MSKVFEDGPKRGEGQARKLSVRLHRLVQSCSEPSHKGSSLFAGNKTWATRCAAVEDTQTRPERSLKEQFLSQGRSLDMRKEKKGKHTTENRIAVHGAAHKIKKILKVDQVRRPPKREGDLQVQVQLDEIRLLLPADANHAQVWYWWIECMP
ncbi:hypothetical protein FOPE_10006 [Fonsecaea pedrosoi]|nr:hypothetical protein FOPE_10006 [Fonsecaea pedrosoi]